VVSSGPTNQHYVPQFHLRQFEAPDKRRHVWRYDKLSDRIELRPIRSSASAPDFYAYDDEAGQRVNAMDEAITAMENFAAPVLQSLSRRSPGQLRLPDAERLALASYLGLLYVRGPAQLRTAQALADFTARAEIDMSLANDADFPERARSAGKTGSDKDLEELRRDTLAQLRKGELVIKAHPKASLASLATGEPVAAILMGMRWYVLRRDHAPHLVLGDAPVAIVRPHGLPDFVGVGPATPGAEAQVPLAPYALLSMRDEDDDGTVTVLTDPVDLGPWPVALSQLAWHGSERYVFGRNRSDLEAVANSMTERDRRHTPALRVSNVPDQWREYLGERIRTANGGQREVGPRRSGRVSAFVNAYVLRE
jgi:hypothetical protein